MKSPILEKPTICICQWNNEFFGFHEADCPVRCQEKIKEGDEEIQCDESLNAHDDEHSAYVRDHWVVW